MKKISRNMLLCITCCAILLIPLQAQAAPESIDSIEYWGKDDACITIREEENASPLVTYCKTPEAYGEKCYPVQEYASNADPCQNGAYRSRIRELLGIYFNLLCDRFSFFSDNDAISTEVSPILQSVQKPNLSVAMSGYAQEVVDLVNQERVEEGLQPLTMDSTLTAAAEIRAGEILETFSHTRPNGSTCFTALDEVGATYRQAGENIAIGQSTPAQVVAAWMNSPGHRENILNSKYTRIGVAVIETNEMSSQTQGYAWAQFFAD